MSVFKLIVISSILFLSACGGSESSDLDGGNSRYLAYVPNALNFTVQVDGEQPASQDIIITALVEDAEMPKFEYDSTYFDLISLNYYDGESLRVEVSVKAPEELGVGEYQLSFNMVADAYSVTIPVSYTITAIPAGDPIISYISPYSIIENSASNYSITGSGFSLLESNSTVMVGDVVATDHTLVSDSELLISLPGLSAGEHAVNISNYQSDAVVKVFESDTFPTTLISNSGQKNAMIYDELRQSIYIANYENGEIQRYKRSNNAWVADSVALENAHFLSLSVDDNTLFAGNNDGVHSINSDDAVMVTNLEYDASMQYSTSITGVVTGNTGTIFIVTDSYILPYDIETSEEGDPLYGIGSTGKIKSASSKDGRFTYFGSGGSTLNEVFMFDFSNVSRSATTADTYPDSISGMSVSPDGSLIVVSGVDIYDSSFSKLGSLPDYVENIQNSVVSKDNNTLYAIGYDFSSFENIVKKYDISDLSDIKAVAFDKAEGLDVGVFLNVVLTESETNLIITGNNGVAVIDLVTP